MILDNKAFRVVVMRVLMHARPGSDRILAGDAVQARATAAALGELGVRAVLLEDGRWPAPSAYDLVHLFNLMPIEATHAAFRQATEAGKPVVLSPVFWNPGEFLAHWAEGDAFRAWWQSTEPMRREVVSGARAILPNSHAELESLRACYGDILPPHVVVPNGVDVKLFRPGPRSGAGSSDVLCVARIARRKNQLGLLEALRGTGLRLRFIGPVNDFAYYRACRAEAWPGVSFLEETRGARLAAAYASAKVHALVSWYETPGLASLEAAACGCRVVSTDRGSAREYLGEGGWYCSPDDPAGIRRAILAALRAPGSANLAALVRTKYTWHEAARATRRGYLMIFAADGEELR